MVYTVELLLELPMRGLHVFLRQDPLQNYFDLITVSMLFPIELWFVVFQGAWSTSFNYGVPCRCLMLLRGSRCLRCLHQLPGPRDLLVKIYSGLQAFTRVLLLLFCVCYFFSQIGMMTLGGRARH